MTFRRTIVLVLVAGACRNAAPPPATAHVAPADSEIPAGPLGAAVRRGQALVLATRDSLPGHVGNALRCVSCHLDEGRRPVGSWIGVYGRYPAYRARSATVETIEFRVNDCFRRSMNGTALPVDGPDMRDIVAYLAFLSRGTAIGTPLAVGAAARWDSLPPDTAAGRVVFDTTCARCHGADGQGTAAAPPVWGPKSFNIGAGMSRVRTAAAFIAANMPFDRPGTVSDRQALAVAAFLATHPRPDFTGKETDWPHGDAPADAAYPTLGKTRAARGAGGARSR
ncbi:MAG TPA: c-type cytochrome [Gemmatimonadales bacterium]|nr:c-type cytochrome [Gemmatimonadales bacterium]